MYRLRTLFCLLVCLSIVSFSVYVCQGAAHERDDSSVIVQVTDKGFEPESVEIGLGDTIVFENVGQKGHWPASDDHPTHTRYPEFDPRQSLEPNTEWSFTFDKAGDWKYHDHQNPYLKGKIIVLTEDGSDTPDGRAEERSKVGSFIASVGAFFLDAYKAVISPFTSQKKESASNDEDKAEKEEAASKDSDAEVLSEERFAEIKDRYVALVRDEDPKVALGQLRDEIETDDALLRSCHALVHDIGREAYEKYRGFSEAMRYQDEICNSGYLHGIIESRFSESEDIFADMRTMCDQYPLESFLSWQCYHGLGHGVMYYTANDLPRSLEMCDAFDVTFARFSCSNGVFMENFSTDQKLHLSEYLKESDPFYPCAEQASRLHKGNCYQYAPTYFLSLNEEDYAGALEWCKNAEEGPFKLQCARGVGAQMIKENINDPKPIESLCLGGEAEQVGPCIDGMVTLYIFHHGSLDPARDLCDELEVSNRQTCYDSVKFNSKLFSS